MPTGLSDRLPKPRVPMMRLRRRGTNATRERAVRIKGTHDREDFCYYKRNFRYTRSRRRNGRYFQRQRPLRFPAPARSSGSPVPRVPPGREQPGDLVFFAGSDGTSQAPGHVGIVISNGEMIEAYAAGYPIRVSTCGQASMRNRGRRNRRAKLQGRLLYKEGSQHAGGAVARTTAEPHLRARSLPPGEMACHVARRGTPSLPGRVLRFGCQATGSLMLL